MHLRTPEGGRICTFCPELRATVPIGVGNNKSIDPLLLYDPSSSTLRIIGSDRNELSSRIPEAIVTLPETITFTILSFLGNIMPADNARGVGRLSSCALQSMPQSSSQLASRTMVLPL